MRGAHRIRRSGMAFGAISGWRGLAWPIFAGFFALVFLMGGGSRPDITSLVVLRPLAAIAIGLSLIDITAAEIRAARPALALLGLFAVMTAIQLVPLPPSWWLALPGRNGLGDTYQAIGMSPPWHPISLVPWRTWNSLFALLVPAAAVLSFVRLRPEQQARTASLLLIAGAVSAILAVAQLLGPPRGPLYLYAVTNATSGVGLFANRNHQAFFLACMLPIFALWLLVERKRFGEGPAQLLVITAVVVFVSVLLVATGSRGGLLLGGIGLVSMLLFFGKDARVIQLGRGRRVDARLSILVLAGLAAVAMFSIASRTDALDRFAGGDVESEGRWLYLRPIGRMISNSFPIGDGVGTFAEVFRWFEPEAILRASYANQAHNDVLDLLISFGILGALPLLLGLYLWGRAAIRLWADRRAALPDFAYRLLGLILTLMLATASLLDYPLRVPSLAMVFVLALTLAGGDLRIAQGAKGKRRSGR